MKFSLFTKYGALNSAPVFSAFEKSLENANYPISFNNLDADVAVIWSVLWKGRMAGNQEVWNHYRSTNRPVVVLEVGNFKRGLTWKVGLNGIGRNNYCYPENLDLQRPKELGLKLKPWNSNGEFILICGQQQESLQWKNQPTLSNWFIDTIKSIKKYSKRPIIIRPHPRSRLPDIEKDFKNVYRQNPQHIKDTYDDYNLEFNNVHATVNWNSNPGVNSILNGVPAIVGPDSLAFDVAETNIEKIEELKPQDRTDWVTKISHTEYTINEIVAGIPLQNLTKSLNSVNYIK